MNELSDDLDYRMESGPNNKAASNPELISDEHLELRDWSEIELRRIGSFSSSICFYSSLGSKTVLPMAFECR